MSSYIKLYRKLLDNPLWTEEPFSRGQAWVDLLLTAKRYPSSRIKRGVVINYERGEVPFSEIELAERWKWSRGKVRRYLSVLEMEQQIRQQKSNLGSCIHIVNYDYYQLGDTADGTTNGTT